MAELFGVITGVLSVVSQATTEIERLVDRCQTFREAPAEFRELKTDCNDVCDLLRELEEKLRHNTSVRPECIQSFESEADILRRKFKNALNGCRNIEKYFPDPGSDCSAYRASFLRLRGLLLRFFFAQRIATKSRHISRTVKDSYKNGANLNRFLYVNVRFNDLGASVQQLDVGMRAVNKSMETIKNEFKDVGNSIKLVNDNFRQNPEHYIADADDDNFRPPDYSHFPALPQEIILDFTTCDEETNVPLTMEGKLKHALLELDSRCESSRIAVAVGAHGKGGVGKTNALIGLGWDIDVRNRFKSGGIYFLSFGKDASAEKVIEQLALTVENSGGLRRAGKIRNSTLAGAIQFVQSWFSSRDTLFLCDDIWETTQNNVGYFNELKQLLASSGRIHMVLSTRAQSIATAAQKPIAFGPRDPEGNLSRSILLKYAGIPEQYILGSCGEHQDAIQRILRKCSGLPLTLGVAGRAIRTKAENCIGGQLAAILIYAEELETSVWKVMTEDVDGYPNLCATVRTSLEMVNEWAEKNEICRRNGEALMCSDLFTRMSVFPRQSWVPERTVKRLWDDVDDLNATRIIGKLVDLSLFWKREDKANEATIGLHDLLLEYCGMQATRDPCSFQRDFLGRFMTASERLMAVSTTVDDCLLNKLPITPEPRGWWSLSSDGYFPENVCWHLWKGGCVGELMGLLCDMRWTAFRMRSGGLLRWENDFECLEGAISDMKKEDGKKYGWDFFEQGVRLVTNAVKEAWVYLKENERELGMQVHSRLFDVGEEIWPVSRYLESVRWHCRKPWLLPRGRYWAHPGKGTNVEVLVGEAVKDFAMTRNGAVVVASIGKDVLVMDVKSRSDVTRLTGHDDEVTSVCISGDGAMILCALKDGTLHRWVRRRGVLMVEPLRGHHDEVSCIAMSLDAATFVSGSKHGTLHIWNGKTGAAIGKPLRGHSDRVTCIAMSEDGKTIVSGSEDRTLRIWDGRDGKAVGDPLHGHDDHVTCVVMTRDGEIIVSGSKDGTLQKWDGRNGKPIGNPIPGHDDHVTCVVMTGDGGTLVSGSKDGTLRKWDGRNGVAKSEPQRGHDNAVSGLAMSEDGTVFMSSSCDDRTLCQWDWRTFKPMGMLPCSHDDVVTCVKISGSGTMIVSGSKDGTLRLWDGRTGDPVGEPLIAHESVSCVAISCDGTIVVSVSHETVQLWDAGTGATIGAQVRSRNLKSIEIENGFALGRILDGSLIRWRIDKTCGLVLDKEQEWEPLPGGSECEDRSWVTTGVRPNELVLNDRGGKQVVATLVSRILATDYKEVSFRAGRIGKGIGECNDMVRAVVVAGLAKGTVCIFHLIDE